ncbi:MAG TPA: hypothetical protein VFB32_05355 [Rudaea sp.]|nr:hypothetical protein [Rudaea sp.]
MRGRSSLIVAAFWLPLIAAGAQRSVLPAWVCSEPDAVFVAGFETGEAPVPHQASGGSGGLYAGDISRQVSVAGLGTQTYYLHIPLHYKPNHPWPLVVALHGAGGPNTSDVYARTVRSDWGGVGEAGGFLVIAPVGTDSTGGGWIEPGAGGEGPSDYDIVAAAIADTEAAYNVDLDRVYLWGYSAGGEVTYDIALTGWSGMNANTFAGIAVTGAALAGCPSYTVAASCVPANAARTIPLDIHMGTADPRLPYAVSDENTFLAHGWTSGDTLFFTEFTDGNPPGGHLYTTADLHDVWTNICPNAVVP